MVISLPACIEGILRLFTNLYLQRKLLIFLRNNRECKVVDPYNCLPQNWPHGGNQRIGWPANPSRFITKWLKRGHVHNLDSLKKELSNKNPAKKAQTHKNSNLGKNPMLRFYEKHNLASKLSLFNKKTQVEFSLSLCSGNQSVTAGVCIFDTIAVSLRAAFHWFPVFELFLTRLLTISRQNKKK